MPKLLLLTIAMLSIPTFSYAQEASTSADTVVKENVIKRIQEVVKGESTRATLTAYPGFLSSIANNTLTIRATDGTKLASTSAITGYYLVPKETKTDSEDMSLDNYIIAIGIQNSTDVLDTLQILIHEDAPNQPDQESRFGTIIDYNAEDDTITLQTNQGSALYTLTHNTEYLQLNPAKDATVPTDETSITTGIQAMIIIDNDTPVSIDTIVLRSSPQDETNQATSSATPPEIPD